MSKMIKSKRNLIWLLFISFELVCIYRYQSHTFHVPNPNPIKSQHEYQHPHSPSSLLLSTNKRSIYINRKLSSLGVSYNQTTSFSKIHQNKVDWDSIEVPEPGYPKLTHLVDYRTSATENEIEKHDRLLVQGFYYMKNYLHSNIHSADLPVKKINHNLRQSMTTTQQSNNLNPNHNSLNPKICLNIYLCNRRIPYINSLFMTLTSFSNNQHEKNFRSSTQVHLLNTEKRENRLHFPYLDEQLSKIDFVYEVHNITYADEIYANVNKVRELDFRETFISDTISGLKICIKSGLPYCIMMEEDAVVPVNFISLLLEQIIQPLEKNGMLNPKDGTGSVSVLSLYSYYNLVFFGPHRLHFARYSKNKYQEDKAKSNIERWGLNMLPYHPQYNVFDKDYKYGTVAMFYTRQSAIELVKYMSKVGVDPIHNADEFINADEYFPTVMNMKRKHISPSLVNHIGYYSERMAAVKSRGMFSQLNTDSRFIFDAGTL